MFTMNTIKTLNAIIFRNKLRYIFIAFIILPSAFITLENIYFQLWSTNGNYAILKSQSRIGLKKYCASEYEEYKVTDLNKTVVNLKFNHSLKSERSFVDRDGVRVYWPRLPDGVRLHDVPEKVAEIGQPWPKPAVFSYDVNEVHVLDIDNFIFIIANQSYDGCDIINPAVSRYVDEIHQYKAYSENLRCSLFRRKNTKQNPNIKTFIRNITLYLFHPCEDAYPSEEMDESYVLQISPGRCFISAKEVWGVLRGLETFYQLLYHSKTDNKLYINSTIISDQPEYRHRGLMIDTSRHFIPIQLIKTNLDAMSQNKMNIFHWHMSDDQSFPFKSKTFPELWKMGAYDINKLYTYDDISEIIEYARLRGIRVIPEFDTPGHVASWSDAVGFRFLCGHLHSTMLDITDDKLMQFMKLFYIEIRQLFKDKTIHIGGDEIPAKCLYLNNKTRDMMKKYTHQELIQEYFNGLEQIIHAIDPEWHIIMWEDSFYKYDVVLNVDNTTIQLWEGYEAGVKARRYGYKMLTSLCWYLDDNGKTWTDFYDCNIQMSGIKGKLKKINYVGGEACMWTEYVNEQNILTTIWPKTIATAERLWNNSSLTHEFGFTENRFHEQACRMQRRGIAVSPLSGAGACH